MILVKLMIIFFLIVKQSLLPLFNRKELEEKKSKAKDTISYVTSFQWLKSSVLPDPQVILLLLFLHISKIWDNVTPSKRPQN